jgi:hypothetical protein
MIRIVQHDREGARTVVFCDHCRRPIERAEDGNYEWSDEDAPFLEGDEPVTWTDSGPMFTVHKDCTPEFEEIQRRAYGREFMSCSELKALPVFLANNLDLEWSDAEQSARWAAGVVEDAVRRA